MMNPRKSLSILTTLIALWFPGLCWSQASPESKPGTKPSRAKAAPIPKPDEGWLKKGVSMGAYLSSDSESLSTWGGSMTCPVYRVKFWVDNSTDRALQLGESLIVVEKQRSSDAVISLYETCEGDDPCPHLRRFEERYGTTFGVSRYRHSVSATAIGDKENFAIKFLGPTGYNGFGYGVVEPKGRREIERDVFAPYGIKENKEYVALVLPYVTIKGLEDSPRIQTVLYYDAATLDSRQQDAQRQLTYGVCASDLSPLIADTTRAAWERAFALNWLAEARPIEVAKLLPSFIIPVQQTNAMLVQAAVLDSGMIKQTSSIPALTKLLESEVFTKATLEPLVEVPKFILMAIGDIGDASVAPIVRPYLDHQNRAVREAAIEALGNLKDAGSVEKLLTLLRDKEQGRSRKVILGALAEIGNKAALDPLLALLRDTAYGNRGDVAHALSKAPPTEVLPTLTQVASDGKEEQEVKKACISALGQLGGPQATALLCALADSEATALHEVALEALGKLHDGESLTCLQHLAEKTGYDKQDLAKRIVETRSFRKMATAPAR